MADHVLGLGGLFFRAENPERLGAWYAEHFGIPAEGGEEPWQQAAGPTVFAPFRQDSDYFPREQSVMVNFRVRDLDDLLERLRTAGVEIDPKRQDESYGRFAWVYDPEGRKIELWEPPPDQR